MGAVAYLWSWLTDAQRAEAIKSALAHESPTVRSRAGQCVDDDVLARNFTWVRNDEGTWAALWGLWSGDLNDGVRVATPEERAK
jgi:hypothetical protein